MTGKNQRLGRLFGLATLAFSVAATGVAHAQSESEGPGETLSGEVARAYEAGVEALRTRNFEGAIEQFDKVLDDEKDHPEANYFMGMAYAYLSDDKRAERHFGRAVKARESFVEAREWLAVVQVRRGDRKDAEDQLAAIRALRASCTADTCDDAYEARATRAIEKVTATLDAAN
ncbi:MAG: hypothetical protein GC152_09065 [Alphaproteobacteria bacterium]|nr:hypothetical protein [Alphaproteobacteria bacterium]